VSTCCPRIHKFSLALVTARSVTARLVVVRLVVLVALAVFVTARTSFNMIASPLLSASPVSAVELRTHFQNGFSLLNSR
jgi:hypothetical protein